MLDISRLLSSAWRGYPSGIDRVEFAYARRCRALPEQHCSFVAMGLAGGFARFPRALALKLLDALQDSLAEGVHGGPAHRRARFYATIGHALLISGYGRASLLDQVRREPGCVLVVVSHRSVTNTAAIARLREAGAGFVPLIHDLIPLTHPEYTRPGSMQAHRGMLDNIARMADAVIVNSQATCASLEGWMTKTELHCPPTLVAPLGFDLPPVAADACLRPASPYFVMLGTIEPRKNHIFLLNLWRDLQASMGPATPRLVIIGRQGWESEAVHRTLERRDTFAGLVEARGRVSDQEVAWLLSGARALLFPSMVEGYGIPVVEALALGLPVIASDIPALREVGAGVPEHLHPQDGAGWRQAILDYMAPDSPRRDAQLTRMTGWRQPDWADHFRLTDALLERVAQRAGTNTSDRMELPRASPVAAARPGMP